MSSRIPVRVLVWAIAALSLLMAPAPVAERARSPLDDCGLEGPDLEERPEQSLFELPFPYETVARGATSGSSPALLEILKGEPLLAEAVELSTSWRASDKRRAIALFQHLVRVSVEQRDSALEQLSVVRLGDLHRSLGLNSESLEFYRRALPPGAAPTLRLSTHTPLPPPP